MTTPLTNHWACRCGATGSYTWASITTTTDASYPEAKHMKTCGQEMDSSTSAEKLARVTARWGRESAA